MTNREAFFKAKELYIGFIEHSDIKLMLMEINGFKSFSELVKNFDKDIKDEEGFFSSLASIKNGYPIQYLVGHAPFLDLDLMVNSDVLIPRPETEQLALLVRDYVKNNFADESCNICDIGTGSGAIAIFLKEHLSTKNVYATDISLKALDVAKSNAKKVGVNVTFLQGDMEEPLVEKNIKLDVLVSNPPYIEKVDEIEEGVYKHEPHLALLANPDTLYYERLILNAKKFMKDDGFMAFEIGYDMEEKLMDVIGKVNYGAQFIFKKDIYGKTRFLLINLQK